LADHWPPSSAEVKEWVELYLHSPMAWCSVGGEHRDNLLHVNDSGSMSHGCMAVHVFCVVAELRQSLRIRNKLSDSFPNNEFMVMAWEVNIMLTFSSDEASIKTIDGNC
jgi:hypothetical protein